MSCSDQSPGAVQSKPRPADLWALGIAFGFILLIVAGLVPHVAG